MAEPTPGESLGFIGALIAAVAALWATLRQTSARELGRLEAALKHATEERQRCEAEKTAMAERLGRRIDELQAARVNDAQAMARALMHARGSSVDVARDWEAEAPTGVRNLMAIVPASGRPSAPPTLPQDAPELPARDWDPYEPTPPRQAPPRPGVIRPRRP